MTSPTPLTGTELIDCAKANAKSGIEVAAKQCGYGNDLNTFSQTLKAACHNIGIDINELSDLITDQQLVQRTKGIEIAPDSVDKP